MNNLRERERSKNGFQCLDKEATCSLHTIPSARSHKPNAEISQTSPLQGFHITFVNTEYNHKRLLKSRGPNSLGGLPTFRFETIPDGLPATDANATQDIPSLANSTSKNCLPPFRDLLFKLNSSPNSPAVTCIVSDGGMTFTLDAAQELGIPNVLFHTESACGFMGYLHYHALIQKGFFPLQDDSCLTNGYLDTVIDWIPGIRGIRLKDIPSFIITRDPNDQLLVYLVSEMHRAQRASAIILNTFDALEHQVLDAFSSLGFLPSIYSIGPLQLQLVQIPTNNKDLNFIGSNLWSEQPECLEWLDSKEPNSVVYVNFGSITVMTSEQLIEFAWGLANTNKPFLWVIRPDLVQAGDQSAVAVPPEFVEETKERGLLASWCPQEQVLSHPSIGGFLTHSGWNSTLESVCGGVPMICWPFFAEQRTNCKYSCEDWGIGMEIEGDVKRDYVEGLVRNLLEGEKGKEMRKKAMEWKKLAEEATTAPNGSSFLDLDKMINKVLLSPRN